MWKILLLVGFFCIAVIASQPGYEIDYKRFEMLYYKKSLVRNSYFFLGKYNRTTTSINVTFDLLEDLDGNHIQGKTTIYWFMNGAFHPTGIETTYNICDCYQKDLFGVRTQLKRYGNITACDIKKGFYYMYNYVPDESYFPKDAPDDKYIEELSFYMDTGEPLVKFHVYFNIKMLMPLEQQKSS